MKIVYWYLKVMEGGIDSRTVMEELVKARELISSISKDFSDYERKATIKKENLKCKLHACRTMLKKQ